MSIFWSLARITIGIAVIGLGSLYLFQRKLIYPSGFPEGSRSIVDKPSSFNMNYQDVSLTTSDGIKIKLYVIIRMADNSEKPAAKTVLMLGPNAGNMGHSLPLARLFYDMGCNVVTVSYRGYGLSEGYPSESGIRKDVESVAQFLTEHESLKNTSIILYGRSLGGAVSVYFANLPEAKQMIKGIILENTFTSLPDVVPNVFPILSSLTAMVSEKWESEKILPNILPDIPFLFLTGTKDELVPTQQMKRLYEICSSKRKYLYEFPKGTHNDTCLQAKYWEEVEEFMRGVIEPVEIAWAEEKEK